MACMARGRRLNIRNGIYHAMARGNRKSEIFEDPLDRARFVEILDEAHHRYGVDIYSECRMGNHYHLVVRTPDANLSHFMGYLNGVFAQYSNRRHKRIGHLFGERFKPILVDHPLYLRVVARYVAMNPVSAGLVATPGDWPWSSFAATAGLAPVPCYLSLDWLDAAFPAALRQDSQERYRAYVTAPDIEEAEGSLAPPVAGSEAHVNEVRALIGATLHGAWLPRAYRALGRPSLSDLFPPDLDKAERASRMLRAHVVHAYRMSEIARSLDLHPNSVSRIVCALRREWKKNINNKA
jgi:REP element-mobilizing transposase RayT